MMHIDGKNNVLLRKKGILALEMEEKTRQVEEDSELSKWFSWTFHSPA